MMNNLKTPRKIKKMPKNRRTVEGGKLPVNKASGPGFIRSEAQGFTKNSKGSGKADRGEQGMEAYAARRIASINRNKKMAMR